MNRCSESERIQEWLDGELPSASARAFERHLDGCRRCEAELGALRTLYASLDRIDRSHLEAARDAHQVLREGTTVNC